jgi:hypothetical protein
VRRAARAARALTIAILTFAPACSRGRGDAASDGAADAGGSDAANGTRDAESIDAARGEVDDAPPQWGEATRATIESLDHDAALRANAATIREHFGATLPRALRVQTTSLAGHTRAILLAADAGEPRPLLLVVDAQGALLWKKDRPVAGITPKVTELAIASRPMGGLALFLYDEPTHAAAARMWDPEGAPFADFQLFGIERCDALSAMRWPGHGWIAVCARPGGARAQLLRESGVAAWGERGAPVGAAWREAAAASIVADTDETWMLFQHAPAPGAALRLSPDHVLAFRYDARRGSLWDAPVDIGVVAHVERPLDRIAVERARLGVVRASIDGRDVEITADGAVTRR